MAVEEALRQLGNSPPNLDLPSTKTITFLHKRIRNHHSEAYAVEELLESVVFEDFTIAKVLDFEYVLRLVNSFVSN